LLEEAEYFFEGICEGSITKEPKGEKGFGYDPVFIPAGADKTFAEMTMEEKNLYSHRRKAVDKLILFLNQLKLN
jgi:XTP/dITP diphosphohydrolase